MKIFILISLIGISLSGCSSQKRSEPVYPEPKISTQEVYALNGSQEKNPTFTLGNRSKDVSTVDPYMLHNTIRTHYRMLINPTIYLFVTTHLSPRYRIPVPSYLTEFKLLEKDEYALPNEANLAELK